jgi:hypothetical protein
MRRSLGRYSSLSDSGHGVKEGSVCGLTEILQRHFPGEIEAVEEDIELTDIWTQD